MGYTVKKGDTLSKIAKDNRITLELLKKLNPEIKDINKIKIGQEINISKKSDQNEQMRSYYAQQNTKLGLNPKQPTILKTSNLEIGLGLYIVPKYINNEHVLDGTSTSYIQNQTPVFNPLLPNFNNLNKDEIMNIQSYLKSAGYDLGNTGKNKDGIDGDWGSKSKKAWEQAQKDGWILKDGKLIKSEQESEQKFDNTNDSNDSIYTPKPSFVGNLLHFIGNVNPFNERPYKGTEEEARLLGYKYYTTNGFTRYPVDYTIEGSENMTAQEFAQALLDKYGITSEQVRDKSPMLNLVYLYSPGYGYNILRMGENIIRGNKVRDKGQRNTETIETPVADKLSKKIANVFDFVGFDNFANDLRESTEYKINESAQRNDISNLYFGYPMTGNTLRISPYTETGRKNKPEHGYFFEFTNDSHIYNDPAYKNAVPGGASVQAKGENMGGWGASVDENGNKVYYDKWDINPFTKIRGLQWLPNMNFMGTSYELYGKQK